MNTRGVPLDKRMRKISWADSTGQPSNIHLTIDGRDTLCGGSAMYISGRKLAIAPKKHQGRSKFCRVCFQNGGKNLPWDERCQAIAWRNWGKNP